MAKTPFDAPLPAWADWWADAACRVEQSSTFFPQQRGRSIPLRQAQRAKAICARCPVQQQCLQAALARRETEGIWGGLTPKERDALAETSVVRA